MCSYKTQFGSFLALVLTIGLRYSPAQTTEPSARPTDDIIYQPPPNSPDHMRVDGSGARGEAGNDLPSLFISRPITSA